MPYRLLTVLFLGLLFAPLWIPRPQEIVHTPANGAISFDPCEMLEQLPTASKAAVILFMAGFATVVGSGLFNRRAPRLATLAFIVGWIWVLERVTMTNQSCWTSQGWPVAIFETAIIIAWSACHLRSPRPI